MESTLEKPEIDFLPHHRIGRNLLLQNQHNHYADSSQAMLFKESFH
jgi:hypothetical protein